MLRSSLNINNFTKQARNLFQWIESVLGSVFKNKTSANSSNERYNCHIPEKCVSFKSQFIPNSPNKFESAMDTLDTLDDIMIDADNLMSHIIFDITVFVLYLISLIFYTLALIDLYNDYQTIFWISLSLLITGTFVNMIFGFFYALEIIKSASLIWTKIITFIFVIIISLPFAPIIYLLDYKRMHNCSTCTHHRKLISLFFHCLCVSLGQSILMTFVVVSMDYNIYYILSLFSCISLMLIYFISISAENEHYSIVEFIPHNFIFTNRNDSFMMYYLCFMMDYSFFLFSIIFCVFDESNIISQIWAYNAVIGALLMSFVITYKEAKSFGERLKDEVFSYLIMVIVFILYYSFFQIVVEISCTVWMVIIYNYIRQNMKNKHQIYDWPLVKWISTKDTVKRLCITNGLIIDRYANNSKRHVIDSERTKITQMKDYVWINCTNNFQYSQINHMKQQRQVNWYKVFFGDNVFDIKTNFKIFIGILFMFSRIIKFVLLPIITAVVILPNISDQSNEWQFILYFILSIQFICVVIAIIILRGFCNEIYCSLYMIGNPSEFDCNNLRKDIGYYYNSIPVLQLHSMIEEKVGSDIADIIVSYLHISDKSRLCIRKVLDSSSH